MERLANAVDMLTEGQGVVDSLSQTSDAGCEFDADALKVQSAYVIGNPRLAGDCN